MSTRKKQLYPIKLNPILKERVWGGDRFGRSIGESWEISGFEDESSEICNGYLDGNTLYDIIETYMGEIVGDDIYKYFGNEFPLLIKTLDIKDKLSVQVHPDDETAYDRHNSYGKCEAWYVIDAKPESVIYMGFNKDMDPNEFYQKCKNGDVVGSLNCFHPEKGDFFYIEPGTIHSAGEGLVIAEIAQICDVTYRLYDWGRENNPQTARQMHHELAFDCINYSKYDTDKYYIPAATNKEGTHILTDNSHFKITSLELKDSYHIYTDKYESFILYCCISGEGVIGENECSISEGEWVLIPAGYKDFILSPKMDGTRLLEIYIVKQEDHDSYIQEEGHHHDDECSCGCHHHE